MACRLKIPEIIIFNSYGKPIFSKSQIFKEKILSAGLLYSISMYMAKLLAEKIYSLTLEKHKILFERMKEITGAIVLNIGENERLASEMLKNLLTELNLKGLDNSDQVINNFFIDKSNFRDI